MKTSSLRSLLPILSGFLILVSGISTTYAILDTNENSLSDLWEKAYNDGELFSPSITAALDSDSDGWTNEQEAAAGTNPFEANPPDGIIQPITQHIPATYLGVDQNGDPAILTPPTQTNARPTLVGKLYTLQFSPNLSAGTWQNVGTPVLGNGDPITIANTLTQPDGSIPEKLFWKLVSTDTDQDGDGLTDAEEAELGTDPLYYDTDGDGLPDGWEMEHGLDPNDAEEDNGYDGDPDEDGLSNFDEWLNGTAPDDDDTDDDTANDGDEVAGGGDPGNAGDGGNPPPPEQLLEVPFAHGDPSLSHSEKWIMTIKGLGPDDHRTLHLAARDFGVEAQKTFKLRKWNHYEVVIDHLATDPEYLYYWGWPDYDWDAYVDSLPASQSIASDGSGTPVNNFFMVKDHWLVDNRSALFTTETHGDDDNLLTGKKAFLVPVAIRDNIEGTGVDNFSITASPSDAGYQDKFWIMAPNGGAAYTDDTHFNVALANPTTLTMSCNNAVPDPTALPTFGSDEPMVSWRGTTGATSDDTPTFLIGAAQDQIDLPIRVKTMKKRTVKVAVYRVQRPGSRAFPQFDEEIKLEIQKRLDKTFPSQTNAWFQVDYYDTTVSYDTHEDPSNPSATTPDGLLIADTPEEEALTNNTAFSGTDSTHDIKILMIDDIRFSANNPYASGQTYNPIRGHRPSGGNVCIVPFGLLRPDSTGTIVRVEPTPKYFALYAVHEVGHVLLGEGHPDAYLPSEPSSGGSAPLQSLPLSEKKKRLMVTGDNAELSSTFLVKEEWDKAEVWLQNIPDVREFGASGNTGNY